jgi:5,10-methylenetetrahydrofolate reductase
VDAGGDVVVTQLFYDVEVFLQFVKDCHSVGLTVPIVPGVQTWSSTCRAHFMVPYRLLEQIAVPKEA